MGLIGCVRGEEERRRYGKFLPQQTHTIESVSGHTYIRKRISLTFFVKKLILCVLLGITNAWVNYNPTPCNVSKLSTPALF